MSKLNKRDYIYLTILISLYLILVLILTRFTYVYGSTTDWQEQHWVLPEYFRNLFYKNHDIFPSFAFNIGGGQNIYNFSYYGLYSPIIVISYFFPFINMVDYVIITSILVVIASTLLFYIWLKRNNFSSNICLLISFLFLCSGPLIFQSHRQIMFINYIPFLILGLIGIDDYYNRKKSLLLIISTFLMIMTSYYFSVGGIFAFGVYGIYKYLKSEPKSSLKSLLLAMIKLAVPIITGVFMSGILLLPTFSAVLNGRSGAGDSKGLDILSLLLPQITLQDILYSPYSLGLTSIAVIAIISGFLSKKKENIILSAIISTILIFPVFIYALNGTLYLKSKALIPFVPLVCLVTANFINDLFINRSNRNRILTVLVTLGLAAFFIVKWHYNKIFIMDAFITGIAIILFSKTGKKSLIYMPVIALCTLCCFTVNINDKLYLASDEKIESSEGTEDLIENVLKVDKGFYRFTNKIDSLENVNKVYSTQYYQTTLYSSVYNKGYNNFYYGTFNNEINFRNSVITNPTKNVLFNILMGNKYYITNETAPIGYDFMESNGKASIYKNDNVFPLGYATDKLMDERNFDKLKYPYTDESLLNYGIVNKKSNDNFSTNIKTFSPEITSINYHNLKYQENKGGYFIEAEDNANMTLNLKEPVKDKVMFIRFHMDLQNKENDTYIIINDVKNKLTCKNWEYQNNNFVFDYVLSSNEPIEKLDLLFKKGNYQISNIEAYTLDYDKVKNIKKTVDPFEVDMEKTSGDVITGKINVTSDGYFILNIPYDKGFTINVDGKSVDYEKVNKSFIGFKIDKGEKNIEITYQAPLQNQGIILSIFGIMMAVAVCLFENRKKEDKN